MGVPLCLVSFVACFLSCIKIRNPNPNQYCERKLALLCIVLCIGPNLLVKRLNWLHFASISVRWKAFLFGHTCKGFMYENQRDTDINGTLAEIRRATKSWLSATGISVCSIRSPDRYKE